MNANTKMFRWLLHNMRDLSDYYCYEKAKTLPKLSDEYFDEGIGYDACTEMLTHSFIRIDGQSFKIIKAMAPIHMKWSLEKKRRFKKDEYILLVTTKNDRVTPSKDVKPTAVMTGKKTIYLKTSVSERKKFLMNYFGDIVALADDALPCGCCEYYSADPDPKRCTTCELIDQEEKEEEIKEWKDLNNSFFNQHKERIPKEFHFLYQKEKDPYMQCIFLANMISLADNLENMEKEKIQNSQPEEKSEDKSEDKSEEKPLFSDDDFPALR